MVGESRLVKLVSKLNRLTQEGQLKWRKITPPRILTDGTDTKIPIFFGAIYKDRNIGIFEERYRGYDDEHDSFYWDRRIVLGLFDDEWKPLWQSEEGTAGLYELIESIRYKLAGVDDFFDAVLGKEKDT